MTVAVNLASVDEVFDLLPTKREHPALPMLRRLGWCLTGSWHEPATRHAEDRVSWAFWDVPGTTPGWVTVAATPCPGDPANDPTVNDWDAATYWCQRKHLHTKRRDHAGAEL